MNKILSLKKLALFCFVVVTNSLLTGLAATAQVAPAERSARTAANDDTRFIMESMQDNQDLMFLSQKAIERASDARVRELAQEILTDQSGLYYSMEQLQVAGAGSKPKPSQQQNIREKAAKINAQLSAVAGSTFDTVWVSHMYTMHQEKYDQLLKAKEMATNPQLKMAINEAIPIIRKYSTKLRTLQRDQRRAEAQRKREEMLRNK